MPPGPGPGEIPSELCPPYSELSRQRSFAPVLHLHAQIVHVCNDCCLQIPRWQASKEARRYPRTIRMAMTQVWPPVAYPKMAPKPALRKGPWTERSPRKASGRGRLDTLGIISLGNNDLL
ncbi:hypothetical protein PYW07_010780 [Mythimna separata]|uniref:Uncharacterized protein n=1 Tax=Mythimna separata TaxID=271217 RepID=A0AAD7Y8C0_MYTSE|nr:hypothetical protein PYW07_010780 [Mythimna separata]